ncbi:MAG: hypothetical protein HYS80_01230 [Candidatus Aenigmarchaeota archaeon]|nr:hypothetical protein [Candidatus Aenigmarchaeota archaeon]
MLEMQEKIMIITIEGADNTGKTTLAKHLSEVLNFKYVKFSAPESMESAKAEYFEAIDSGENLVLDRSWVGEFVYAPLWRNYAPDYWEELEKKLSQQKVLNILLHSPKPILRENQGEDSILKQHGDISNAFINIFNKIKSGILISNRWHFPK